MPYPAKILPLKQRMRRVRTDGFINKVTGLGTSRDKATYSRFVRERPLSAEELDALYSGNDMAARVADVVPEEELRQGYKIVVAPDAKDESGAALEAAASISEAVHDHADDLDLTRKFIESRVWGRVFGGGALILGADDGARDRQLAEPLNEDGIQTFDHLNVVDRRFLHPHTFYDDPTGPKHGQVETFMITPQATDRPVAGVGTLIMHETRLQVFGGTRTTIRTRQENGGWDTAVLQRMSAVLTQFGVSWDTLSHVLQDAHQGVFKMHGFIDALGAEGESEVMRRLSLMDMARSAVRAVIVDEEGESFERQNFNWSGIREPYELVLLRLASAARMPVTVLMGQSPSGMDATGESDIRWFYDTIRTSQQNEVKPALERILRLIMLAKSGPTGGQVPESWAVTFPSLWQPTPEEQAQIEKTVAEKDAIYIDRGVVSPEEVAVARYGPDGFSAETPINLEERRAILEGGDLDEDFENTPTLGDDAPAPDVQKQALTGAQTSALMAVAGKVQSGELDRDSGIAIVLASIPSLSPEEAAAIVGKEDPEKAEQRAAMVAGLAAASAGSSDDGPPSMSANDDDGDEG